MVYGPDADQLAQHADQVGRLYNRDVAQGWKAGDPVPDDTVCLTTDIVPGAISFLDQVVWVLPRGRELS